METPRTASRRVHANPDVLHATDTALRLVNQALGELGAPEAGPKGALTDLACDPGEEGSARLLAEMVARANAEIVSLLGRIQFSRGLLHEAHDARLRQMRGKLSAVSASNEVAATHMLDGLERAIAEITTLEQEASVAAATDRRARYAALREELYGVISYIQFQDISSQQIEYAASVIDEAEQRLVELAELFRPVAAPGMPEAPRAARPSAPYHVDPDALADKAASQAFADALFDHR